MTTTTFAPNAQSYKTAIIEAQKFARGWTAVIYWDETNQSVACVGAVSHDAALDRARQVIDTCFGLG